ncbi:hypothetical protein ACP70R_014556 [Stipagrostis hirtigluma subsp. patula]
MAPPPPELVDDAAAEVLLRIPPDDPVDLVRAAAVCKPWLRILCDPAFLRRYRDFHGDGTPLLLGFLRNPDDRSLSRFVPTSSFRPTPDGHRSCYALDCRHGRALLYDYHTVDYVVWDPISGQERRMRDEVPDVYTRFAVLCAAAGGGCDHRGCSGGPSLLACVGVERTDLGYQYAHACFFSFDTGERGRETYIPLDCQISLKDCSPALVGGALYVVGKKGILLRYDILGDRDLSVIEPPEVKHLGSISVMTMEDGGLGLASLYRHKLRLWSREMGPDGDAGWAKRRVIDLRTLLPLANPKCPAYLSGFAEGANVIFVSTDDDGVFSIKLESLLTRKVCELGKIDHLLPYVSFYIPPVCASGTLPSRVETQ